MPSLRALCVEGRGTCSGLTVNGPGSKKVIAECGLERSTTEGDSPVFESYKSLAEHLSRPSHVKPGLNLRGPSRKAKYSLMTDSELSSASER